MNEMLLAIMLLVLLLVLAHILLSFYILQEFLWIKAVLIPWMNNIGNHVNPNHTTLPGDDTSG